MLSNPGRGNYVDMRERPEAPSPGWRPPAGSRPPRRPDSADAWRAGDLSDREVTIAVAVSVVVAVVVPYVGFLLGLLLIAERRTLPGIVVLMVSLMTIPLFPLWQTLDASASPIAV